MSPSQLERSSVYKEPNAVGETLALGYGKFILCFAPTVAPRHVSGVKMISKINKIKNLGLVFADFTWNAGTRDFKAVNLIYGWNGCGKTTLARLFDIISSPSTETKVEFEIEDETGSKFTSATPFPRPIRVFNQDYIQKNVRILESSANTISITLGEENKDLVAQIEADEIELNGNPADASKVGKIKELYGYQQKKERKEKGNETAFSDIARTIGAAIVGSGAASRTYRSPDAKKDFAALQLPALLQDSELELEILALKQSPLPTLKPVEIPSVSINNVQSSILQLLQDCEKNAAEICAKTVQAETIKRLSQNPDIANWVEEGQRLHLHHNSVKCEYCGNVISQDRITQLARHFNEADRELKLEIESNLKNLREIYTQVDAIKVCDSARLYVELQPQYISAESSLITAKSALLSSVTEIDITLQSKKNKTEEVVMLPTSLDSKFFEEELANINKILKEHNGKSKDFQVLRDSAVNKIKAHYLSTIYADVTRRNEEIKELIPDLQRRVAEIETIQKRIAEARSKISSAHKACDQINDSLKTFLGREELRFEPDKRIISDATGKHVETIVGYRIVRGNQRADYLSEGEKTAIAFVYFVVHLHDGQFPRNTGIVVIDDPISSLDSNSLYQAFSFLKNAVKDCYQVFVLTHSFDFLKLLLNWRQRLSETGYFVIRNNIIGNARRALIVEMDKELREYESEYQYLFKQLKEMQAEQDGSIMRAYHVPNIARKVWESFLMFRVPNSDNPYKKMDQLKTQGFDAQKLDAIYKFTNDQSHITGSGFDPSLVPETQKVLNEIFEMMKKIAPEHYAVLDSATS